MRVPVNRVNHGEDKMRLTGRTYLTLAATIAAASPLEAQEPTPVPVPLFQPAKDFGAAGPSNAPKEAKLTAQEEASFKGAIAGMEAFPAYLFSGGHDRAHAAYLLLPPALRSKTMKIWVIAPGRYTAVLPGLIGLKGSGAAQMVSWGFHVALAYRDAAGKVRVADPMLKPGEVLTEQQWFDLMSLPRMSMWTLTDGDLYLFEASNLDPTTGFASFVWNGNREFPTNGRIAGNIARDAVGVDATAGTACAQVNSKKADPGGLFDLLSEGQAGAPPSCQPSIAKFQAELARWEQILKSAP